MVLGNELKPTTYYLIAAVLFVVGCGRDPALTTADDPPTQRADDKSAKPSGRELKEASQSVVWQPSMLVDGYMFEDAKDLASTFGVRSSSRPAS